MYIYQMQDRLAAAKTARRAAQALVAKTAADAQLLAEGHEQACAETRRLQQELAAQHAAHGKQLALHVAAGGALAHAVILSAPGDDLAEKLAAAQKLEQVRASAAALGRASHEEAITGERAAFAELREAACAVLDAELVRLADEFTTKLDYALKIGFHLATFASVDLHRPINQAAHSLPGVVEAALARLPRQDPMHMSLAALRNPDFNGNVYGQRMQALMECGPAEAAAA